MLVDVEFPTDVDPTVATILNIIAKNRPGPIRIQRGVYQIGHFSLEHLIGKHKVKREGPVFNSDLIRFAKSMYETDQKTGRESNSYVRSMLHVSEEMVDRLHKGRKLKPDAWSDGSEDLTTRVHEYGVCDDPQQLLDTYDFEADPRSFVISVTRIDRDDEPDRDGWRWEKWGQYIGDQTPQSDYLRNEPEITHIFCYHVYELETETSA